MTRLIIGLILVLALSVTVFPQKSKIAAEDFSGVDLNGSSVELSALKGKIVVVTFWTTRCPICHHEIPKLNQLAAAYKNQNVVFLGLTTDNEAVTANYLKNMPFDFTIVPNSFGALVKYADKTGGGNIRIGYPAHFLINQDGEIEFKTEGFDKTAQLNSGIARLLAAHSAKAE